MDGEGWRGYGRCLEYSKIFPYNTFDFGQSVQNGPRTTAEQVRPDGLDMTCREHRIRELDIVELPGRMAIEWARAKVHSDQLYHSRPDVNAGLVVG